MIDDLYPSKFTKRSIQNYQQMKKNAKYKSTNLYSIFLSVLDIVVPDNPLMGHYYLKKYMKLEEMKEFGLRETIVKSSVKIDFIEEYLYILRSAKNHAIDGENLGENALDSRIDYFYFENGGFMLKLDMLQMEKLLLWIGRNVTEEPQMSIFDAIENVVDPGMRIPKVRDREIFVKGIGIRRGYEAVIYYIANKNNPYKPYEKGINRLEFEKAYKHLLVEGRITRRWFEEKLTQCSYESGCNYSTMGGIFELIGVASRGEKGYVKV